MHSWTYGPPRANGGAIRSPRIHCTISGGSHKKRYRHFIRARMARLRITFGDQGLVLEPKNQGITTEGDRTFFLAIQNDRLAYPVICPRGRPS